MKLAIIGSRCVQKIDIGRYLPKDVEEIVSGGATGADKLAAEYAKRHGIPLVEFLPDYKRYRSGAPIRRNEQIAAYADQALAFWDGSSRGTKRTIELFHSMGKQVTVIRVEE